MTPKEFKNYAPYQQWINDLTENNREVRNSEVEWTLKVGANQEILLFALARVEVFIPEEKRTKSNERIFMRPDINYVLAYLPKPIWEDSQVLLVKEFRSNTRSPYVWELPGGSSLKESDPKTVAVNELEEETGLKIATERIKFFQSRQVASNLATHKANVFVVALSVREMLLLKTDTKAHGISKDSEQTFVEVVSLKDILNKNYVDWGTTGMILAAMNQTKK